MGYKFHEELTLRDKILSAKSEGLSFLYCEIGTSVPITADRMLVYGNWTDREFEEKLAEAVSRLRKAKYLAILKDLKLI